MWGPAKPGQGRPARSPDHRGPASVGLAPTWWAEWSAGGSRHRGSGPANAGPEAKRRGATGTGAPLRAPQRPALCRGA